MPQEGYAACGFAYVGGFFVPGFFLLPPVLSLPAFPTFGKPLSRVIVEVLEVVTGSIGHEPVTSDTPSAW